ncbi:hypothetical protein FQA39_LY13687 [Lamprigera yunnana]|nr:hypothetical protein FQA39_LY13687 [Lamprigera yunnana]
MISQGSLIKIVIITSLLFLVFSRYFTSYKENDKHKHNMVSSTLPFAILLITYTNSQFLSPVLDNSAIHFVTNLNTYHETGDSLAHPAVVQNAIRESQLPPQLLNPFYKNPIIAANLAKESLLQNQESPVFHREAENIRREEVLKIFERAKYFQNRRK